MSEEDVNKGLREEAAERKRKALTRVETLDLSQTTWPEPPPANRQRRHVRRKARHAPLPQSRGPGPSQHARRAPRGRAGRLILGNGAAELLERRHQGADRAGQQLLTLWPSYPLYPLMARRAHGQAMRCQRRRRRAPRGRPGPPGRAVAIANPNDPTGELIPAGEIERLLSGDSRRCRGAARRGARRVRRRTADAASLDLLAKSPRLLVFRTFSKAWGLAGLRIGYAIGGPGSEALLAELDPDLGVSEVSQAGALEALRTCSELLENRVKDVCRERPVLIAGLRERGFEVADSQANFVWAAHPSLSAGELSSRLEGSGILIAPGDALGEPAARASRSTPIRPPSGCSPRSTKRPRRASAGGCRPGAAAPRWCPRGSCATRCWTRAAGRSARPPCARA